MRIRLAATVAVLAAAVGIAGAVTSSVTAAFGDQSTSVSDSSQNLAGRSRIAP